MALVGATLRVTWSRGAPLAVEPRAALTDAGRVTGFLAGTVAPVLAFFHRSPTGALRAEYGCAEPCRASKELACRKTWEVDGPAQADPRW
jgi:hypothetical protein